MSASEETMDHGPIEIRVKYFSMIRQVTGKKKEDLIVVTSTIEKATTFRELLKKVCELNPPEFRARVLDPEGRVREQLAVFFEGTPIRGQRWDEAIPGPGDLSIFPPVGGG